MKLYFVESGTSDNYIMLETAEGIRCDNCAPSGEFAGVPIFSHSEDDGKIPPEAIAARIKEALDPNLEESDFDWMPICYANMQAWEQEQEEAEYFNRDMAVLIAEI